MEPSGVTLKRSAWSERRGPVVSGSGEGGAASLDGTSRNRSFSSSFRSVR
jgi:hypothetical protein